MKEISDEMIFNEIQEITNESGTFYLGKDGKLIRYENTFCFRNNAYQCFSLIIPEGVRELSEQIFRGYIIHYLILPVSLKTIARTAFSGTCISKIILPSTLDRGMMQQLAHALRFSFTWRSNKLLENFPAEYIDIYQGKSEPKESWMRICNSSGTFFLDSDSILMDFQPAEENLISKSNMNIHLEELDIPMGVEQIPNGALKRLYIEKKISFPKTLKWIGHSSFAGCHLPDMVLPTDLELLAPSSFWGSSIDSLIIPSGLQESCVQIGGRRFKDSGISKICVPIKYREALLEAVLDRKRCSDIIVGEYLNTEFGMLFFAQSQTASMGWSSFMERVFSNMLKVDKKDR